MMAIRAENVLAMSTLLFGFIGFVDTIRAM
jgi:hypothetical protein